MPPSTAYRKHRYGPLHRNIPRLPLTLEGGTPQGLPSLTVASNHRSHTTLARFGVGGGAGSAIIMAVPVAVAPYTADSGSLPLAGQSAAAHEPLDVQDRPRKAALQLAAVDRPSGHGMKSRPRDLRRLGVAVHIQIWVERIDLQRTPIKTESARC